MSGLTEREVDAYREQLDADWDELFAWLRDECRLSPAEIRERLASDEEPGS